MGENVDWWELTAMGVEISSHNSCVKQFAKSSKVVYTQPPNNSAPGKTLEELM